MAHLCLVTPQSAQFRVHRLLFLFDDVLLLFEGLRLLLLLLFFLFLGDFERERDRFRLRADGGERDFRLRLSSGDLDLLWALSRDSP